MPPNQLRIQALSYKRNQARLPLFNNIRMSLRAFLDAKTKKKESLVLLAAFIVFITYIVKDVLRESLKDIVSSIDSAESYFLIRASTFPLMQSLSQIDGELGYLTLLLDGQQQHQSRSNAKLQSQINKLSHNRDSLDKMEFETAQSIDSLRRLLNKVPDSAIVQRQFVDVEKEWDTLKAADSKFHQSVINGVGSDSEKNNETYLSTIADLNGIDNELNTIATQSLQKAEIVRQRRERWLNVFTPLSIALFIIGWTLALYANLHGKLDVAIDK